MRHSLHSHIIYLEHQVQSLRDRLTSAHLSAEERQELDLRLSMADLALARYREAYALELGVSGEEPPSRSGNGGDGSSTPKGLRPKKNDSGLAGAGIRARSRSSARPRAHSAIRMKRAAG